MEVQRGLILDNKATPSAQLPGIEPDMSEGSQTTHFSVIDKDGNRVAGTITINTWYGAGFMPPGTGVILNNEMDDFAIKRGVPNEFGLIGDEANSVAPGKRPLSSMSPSFLESDRGVAIVGTPGGSRIITMVMQAALAWQQGADAEEMVSAKRFHHQYWPDVVNYEPGAISDADIEELSSMGHNLSPARRPYGNMNIVTWDYATNEVQSATDPRGEGEGRVY
jgi:gamma-glutamyltranspeptidase/glutathione hydrolase